MIFIGIVKILMKIFLLSYFVMIFVNRNRETVMINRLK